MRHSEVWDMLNFHYPPEPSVPDTGPSDLPKSDLDIPDDPILDLVNSQCHSHEDLDQALQAYQA